MKTVERVSLIVLAVVTLCPLGWTGCGGESTDEGGVSVFEGRRRKKRTEPVPAPAPAPEPTVPPPAPPPSEASWTVLSPSADTRFVYVSSSAGNDANNGLSEAAPKATISAGKGLCRAGYPDWLLLKAGDTWTNQSFGNFSKSGRSASEPMVISSYGSGARPFIKTGTSDGLDMFGSTPVSHVYIVGLHLKAHTFTGSQGATGMFLLADVNDILVEDCMIEGYSDNFVVQNASNFRLRYSVVVDSYSTASHSQGIYAEGIDGLLIEQCVFDHNGWKEGVAGAGATMYNHNIYINGCSNVVVRGNLFLRASSIGNKYNSDGTGAFQNLLVENNFYIEGEVGISCGGNSNDALRFVDVTIRDNVLMHIGRTQPTNRGLAWYLDVQDWDGGTIANNLFLHQPMLDNSYGISLAGSTERNVSISGNVFYGIQEVSMDIDVSNSESNITVDSNELQDPTEGSRLIIQTGPFSNVAYTNNKYYSNASASAWFLTNGTSRSYSSWVTASGETGSSSGAIAYPAPGRNEVTYQASLGGTATFAAFVAEARLQAKNYWRPEYAAPAVNDYMRAGFGR
jgi:hypothetical protein